jgi:hypothetical protein
MGMINTHISITQITKRRAAAMETEIFPELKRKYIIPELTTTVIAKGTPMKSPKSGVLVGTDVGCPVGRLDGWLEGCIVGMHDGWPDGNRDGSPDGWLEGYNEGCPVGCTVGWSVG